MKNLGQIIKIKWKKYRIVSITMNNFILLGGDLAQQKWFSKNGFDIQKRMVQKDCFPSVLEAFVTEWEIT